jgi:hypothetical protein
VFLVHLIHYLFSHFFVVLDVSVFVCKSAGKTLNLNLKNFTLSACADSLVAEQAKSFEFWHVFAREDLERAGFVTYEVIYL